MKQTAPHRLQTIMQTFALKPTNTSGIIEIEKITVNKKYRFFPIIDR